ncbi:MAG: LysR family transcriptional regulator [Lachnospiraceae bacterium]|nr:LysR family transcriptional regulator [Lachnospiraceae bacterium]
MLDSKVETFMTICKYMNFTKAADALHITQPAVSSQMKRLEEYYGNQLFHYENKQITLTPVGEAVYQEMLRMENQEKNLKKQLVFMETNRKKLFFGATMTIGEFLLADIIQSYICQFPDSSLHMQVANTKSLLQKLDEGEIDFAFIEGNYSKCVYKSYPFRKSRFIPVCGKESPLFHKSVSLGDVLKERLIIREPGSGTRDIFENILKSKNHDITEFSGIIEIGNMNAIKDLVLRSVGISFLYEDVVKKELEEQSLSEVKLSGWNVTHKMNVVWRAENNYGSLVEEFLTMPDNGIIACCAAGRLNS